MTSLLSVFHRHLPCVLGLAFFLSAVSVAPAADPTVRAHLERGISVIGDPVTLELKITGAHRLGNPPEIIVDGLEIQFVSQGTETMLKMDNGAFVSERTTNWAYQIVPQKNGSFTIPAITISVDGKNLTTQPVTLKVQPSAAPEEEHKPAFAELVIQKKTAYLGESIPAELRLYLDSQLRIAGPLNMPELGGDGFTKQQMPQPRQDDVERDNRTFKLLTFKTVITPIRAGKLTVGPSETSFVARVPRAQRSGGGRDPFDIFGGFGGSFFGAEREIKVKTDAVELTVKPLPQNGKPADFSGAVGTFQLSAEGSPRQVKIGDPITMKLRVAGRGNFDRVSAPSLDDPTGWRAYPPSTAFSPDDPVNYTGTKTFEMAVIPEEKKTTMPVFHFSYFDPGTEKYVTVNSEASPLVVEGSALPAPAAVTSTPDAKPPAPEKRANDIVGLRYDSDSPHSFAPLYERPEFWLAQGAVGFVFLVGVGLKLRRRPDAAVRQKAALRQEKEAVWRRLKSHDLGHADFFDAAARLAQIETALATGRAVGSIDAAAVRASAQLDDGAGETIDEIFSARAELHYAGGGIGDGGVTPANRERVIGALKQLEKSHAKN